MIHKNDYTLTLYMCVLVEVVHNINEFNMFNVYHFQLICEIGPQGHVTRLLHFVYQGDPCLERISNVLLEVLPKSNITPLHHVNYTS